MSTIADYPLALLFGSLLVMWGGVFAGRRLFRRRGEASSSERDQVVLILNAALTLLALLIGFSFALAASRYDLRKSYEAAEANAIGTEYVRADLLPSASAARVHAQLASYLAQRILYYEERDPARLRQIAERTAQLQGTLWSEVADVGRSQPSPVIYLVVWGMNDVLNAQSFTQAAWWNRIPAAAWVLLFAVAIPCAWLLGRVEYGVRLSTLLLLPLILAIALFLIADIDSPRHGVIRVDPENLIALAHALPAPGQPPAD